MKYVIMFYFLIGLGRVIYLTSPDREEDRLREPNTFVAVAKGWFWIFDFVPYVWGNRCRMLGHKWGPWVKNDDRCYNRGCQRCSTVGWGIK